MIQMHLDDASVVRQVQPVSSEPRIKAIFTKVSLSNGVTVYSNNAGAEWSKKKRNGASEVPLKHVFIWPQFCWTLKLSRNESVKESTSTLLLLNLSSGSRRSAGADSGSRHHIFIHYKWIRRKQMLINYSVFIVYINIYLTSYFNLNYKFGNKTTCIDIQFSPEHDGWHTLATSQ